MTFYSDEILTKAFEGFYAVVRYGEYPVYICYERQYLLVFRHMV